MENLLFEIHYRLPVVTKGFLETITRVVAKDPITAIAKLRAFLRQDTNFVVDEVEIFEIIKRYIVII